MKLPVATPLLLTLLLTACHEPPAGEAPQASATTLPFVTLTAMDSAVETTLEGVIEAVNQSTVSSQASGRVVELPYDVGDYVPQDAVIVRLRGKEPKARHEQALAAVVEAEAALREAQAQLQRAESVHDKKLLSDADMDRVRHNTEQARARYEAAQAAATEAQAYLEYTVVRAPYSGVVTERLVQIGETVHPGTPLMSGIALEKLRVVVDVPQSLIQALATHRQARVIFPDGRSLNSSSMTIFPYADPRSHTVKVRVALPDGGQALYPGMLVKIAFVAGHETVLPLPAAAIAQRSEVTGVYVQHDNALEFRQIRLGGERADGSRPVLAGLVAGEKVVLDPVAAAASLKSAQVVEEHP